MNELALECREVTRSYKDGEHAILALDRFTRTFRPGEAVAVTGPSGSGKSTLLALLAAIDHPDEGEVILAHQDGVIRLSELSTEEQSEFRAGWVSFLSPEGELLPMLTVYENIALALSMKPLSEAEIDAAIRASLARVGIPDLAHRDPRKLSSGERARAGMARAIAGGNPVLVADEPTAHLDESTAADVAGMLAGFAHEDRRIVIVATHDPVVAERLDARVQLRRPG